MILRAYKKKPWQINYAAISLGARQTILHAKPY